MGKAIKTAQAMRLIGTTILISKDWVGSCAVIGHCLQVGVSVHSTKDIIIVPIKAMSLHGQ